MRLTQSFEVPVPMTEVWGILVDVEQVAPCLPGTILTSYDGTVFGGLVTLTLGRQQLSYRGSGRFVERDEPGKRLVLVATGRDQLGAGEVQVRMTVVLHAARAGASTLVKVLADVELTGAAARVGSDDIAYVGDTLVKQFANRLARVVAVDAGQASPPVVGAAAPAPAPAAAPAPAPAAAPAPASVPAPAPAPAPAAVAPVISTLELPEPAEEPAEEPVYQAAPAMVETAVARASTAEAQPAVGSAPPSPAAAMASVATLSGEATGLTRLSGGAMAVLVVAGFLMVAFVVLALVS